MILFTKEEVQSAVDALKTNPTFTELWTFEKYGIIDPADPPVPEQEAFLASKGLPTTGEGKAVGDYKELAGEPLPHSNLTAQQMAKLVAFLKANGSYRSVPTLDLGNCLYAAFLRGVALKREVATMHVRRIIVECVCQYPEFFCKFLRHSLAKHYGLARPSPEEVDRMEQEGEITHQLAEDYRLPDPFSLVSYLEHIPQDRTWGDVHILTLMSLIWQIGITVLDASNLKETRIRHKRRISQADLIVILTGETISWDVVSDR